MNNPPQPQFSPGMGYKFETKNPENIDNMRIRPIRVEDSYFINEIRTMDGVFENLTSVYSERISFSHNFINSFSPECDHVLVAEIMVNNYPKILGMVGLHINRNPRQRHSASLGIFVHPAYHKKGIAKKLMDKIIELSDEWMALKRIELEVVCDNTPAINLYKKYGFKQEGVKKDSVIKNGKYVDIIIMARYK